jgi:hypothetical protein
MMSIPDLPTPAQTLECFRVCYYLTEMYQPLYIVRLDERTNEIVIVAGQEIAISIDREGKRRVE